MAEKTTKTIISLVYSLAFVAAINANAATVIYTLDNVVLSDNTQMTGTFLWTFDVGDFENGAGQFTFLAIPHTSHDHTDLKATIDVGQSVEITLPGSTHDDGVDITLVLLQPLTPITSASIDLVESKYEIGGNGFHDGVFLSGSVSPNTDSDGDSINDDTDNCSDVANATQLDTDADAIGNFCDPDISVPNDCFVNFLDLAALSDAFFSNPLASNWNADADLNGDETVNFLDLNIARTFFFGIPGPSGLPNACD